VIGSRIDRGCIVLVLRPSGVRRPLVVGRPAAVSKSHLHPPKIIPGSRGVSKMATTVFRYRSSANFIGLAGGSRLWIAVDIHPLKA